MNNDTRHLVDTSEMSLKEWHRLQSRNYKEIQDVFLEQSKNELNGKKEVMASNEFVNKVKSHNRNKRRKAKRKARKNR